MSSGADVVEQRLKDLEAHLAQENPVLLNVVQSFRALDRIAYGMGLLARDQSYAAQIPWWPLISILGTFSAGKSTFINHFLGERLQRTGNQAVDDRFTVICFSRESAGHALPGAALDSDPRFPLYQISKDIEAASAGDGERVDAYLQLKTSPSERLRGRILIDSPGFDADAQRTATLRITDHIIGLSDLVLVFFDARHPEPGAMRDTLGHLVSNTVKRTDSGKFLYILNQLDTAAREDNPEDVVAAWQRALGEEGLTAGRFYTIYNPDAATPIEDAGKRERYEKKRDEDLGEIHRRMEEVEVERAYRIVSALRKTTSEILDTAAPLLQRAILRWRHRTFVADGIVFGLLLVLFLVWSIGSGHWKGFVYEPEWLISLKTVPWGPETLLAVLIMIGIAMHVGIRRLAAKTLMPGIRRQQREVGIRGDLIEAFTRSTRPWRPLFAHSPVGWGGGVKQRLLRITEDCDSYVQTLNDSFTNPSGDGLDSDLVEPAEPAERS